MQPLEKEYHRIACIVNDAASKKSPRKSKQWLDAAFCAGLDKAVQLLRKEINTCHGPHSATSIACQPCVARENSIVDIEAYRDRHGKKRECSICKGNGFLDVEKYDRVEQKDCKWCGTTGIEPQPPMP